MLWKDVLKVTSALKRDGKLKNLAIFGGLEIPEKVLFKQNAFKKLVITC